MNDKDKEAVFEILESMVSNFSIDNLEMREFESSSEFEISDFLYYFDFVESDS